MAQIPLLESQHNGEFIVSEAFGHQSRNVATIHNYGVTSLTLPAGLVLSKQVDPTVVAPFYGAGDRGVPSSVIVQTPGAGYTAVPTAAGTSSGSGATFDVTLGVVAASVPAAGGTLYVVGDKVTLPTGGGVTTPGVFEVTAVSAGGVVTALAPFPTSPEVGGLVSGVYTAVPTNPVTPASTTSVAGTGLTITTSMGVAGITTSGGTLYTQDDAVAFTGGTPTTPAAATIKVTDTSDLVANAVLYPTVIILPNSAAKVTIMDSNCEVNGSELKYDSSLAAADIVSAIDQLSRVGIKVR